MSGSFEVARAVYRDPSDRSSLWNCNRLKVLKLKGNSVERARLHGELLKTHLTPEILLYFTGKSYEPFAALPKWAGTPARLAFSKWLKSLLEPAPQVLRDELHALAEGAGLTREQITAALCGPDLANLANSMMLNPAMAWSRMRFGCTTVSGRNQNGDFVLARNLDFPGVGVYDKNPLVIVHLPIDKSELKRVAIGADGVHFASISAVNEAGIGLVIHQNFTQIKTARSTPLLFIGDWILRQARSLEEAVELLRKHRPGPLWTFVFFDLHKGKTVAVEASRDHFGVRESEPAWGGIAQANHCLSNEAIEHQLSSHGTYVNSCRRLKTVADTCRNSESEDLVSTFAEILASHSEKHAPELSIYDDIIKPITIQSVIFDAPSGRNSKLGRLLVSQDLAPSSSGTYVELDLDALFSDDATSAPEFKVVDLLATPETQRVYQQKIALAAHLSFDERKDREAFEILRGHNSPGLLLMRAVLAYRADLLQECLELVTKALESEELPKHIRQSAVWVQAVCLDAQEKKAEARALAQKLCSEGLVNATIARNATRLAQGQRLRAHERNLIYDFFAGDLVTLPQAPLDEKELLSNFA